MEEKDYEEIDLESSYGKKGSNFRVCDGDGVEPEAKDAAEGLSSSVLYYDLAAGD